MIGLSIAIIFGNKGFKILATCTSEKIEVGRSYQDSNIDISSCFFHRESSYNGDGGVIYVQGSSFSIIINNAMFHECFCNSKGGAIFFDSLSSNLNRICASSCLCSTFGQFAYLIADQNNYAQYLSVTLCGLVFQGNMAIRYYEGNQKFDYSNCSMNKAMQYSGVGFGSSISFTSSYCTFSNNIVQSSFCIYFYFTKGTMFFSNIVHNNSPSQSAIIKTYSESPKMDYCIFAYNQNTLFNVEAGSLTLSHCFISHQGVFSISTSVTTSNNNSIVNRPTYKIQFFNSQYCNTDIPLPDQTPERSPTIQQTLKMTLFETPKQTIEETLMHSPLPTIERTLIETPFQTHEETLSETPLRTHEETLPRTYDHQCSCHHEKNKEMRIIFSFSFVYAVF